MYLPGLASNSEKHQQGLLNTHLDSEITAGLLTRAAEARAEKGAALQLPQALDSTTASLAGLKTTLQGSLSYAGGALAAAPTHWSPSLPSQCRNGEVSNGDLNYRYQHGPNQLGNQNPSITRVAPAFHRQDTTKVVGNWAPMALTLGHVHQLHERLCKDSNALRLGPSTWASSEKRPDPEIIISEKAPVPPAESASSVPFIDFLGVGAA